MHKQNKKTIDLNFANLDTFGTQTEDQLYEFIKTRVETDERVYFLLFQCLIFLAT